MSLLVSIFLFSSVDPFLSHAQQFVLVRRESRKKENFPFVDGGIVLIRDKLSLPAAHLLFFPLPSQQLLVIYQNNLTIVKSSFNMNRSHDLLRSF